MGDAAQGEPLKHEVFEKPFKVEPRFEFWATPDSYRRNPYGDKLPDKIKVWRVQNTKKTYGGVVSRSWGFDDSPDAEILTAGYNDGKEYGAVGVGRHGNFLQWGFSAAPSQMTDAGRAFFLNCVCYIRKFDGKQPLVRRKFTGEGPYARLAEGRSCAVAYALFFSNASAENKAFFLDMFPKDLIKRFEKTPRELVQYYKDNLELVYWDKVPCVDLELQSLGIDSNRKPSTLQRLIALLNDKDRAGMAKRLLKRYVEVSFETPAEWQAWFEKNRDRIYFSDIGGYKFRVIPEGYLK